MPLVVSDDVPGQLLASIGRGIARLTLIATWIRGRYAPTSKTRARKGLAKKEGPPMNKEEPKKPSQGFLNSPLGHLVVQMVGAKLDRMIAGDLMKKLADAGKGVVEGYPVNHVHQFYLRMVLVHARKKPDATFDALMGYINSVT